MIMVDEKFSSFDQDLRCCHKSSTNAFGVQTPSHENKLNMLASFLPELGYLSMLFILGLAVQASPRINGMLK